MATLVERARVEPVDVVMAEEATAPAGRWLARGLFALAGGMALNTVLGPLVLDVIDYPFSESVRNQALGLEAVSLGMVAPLCVVAGALVRRRHPAGPLLAIGPATYAAYMLVQYVIGPQYLVYPRSLPLHLGLFVISVVVAVQAWASIDLARLPDLSGRARRRRGVMLCVLAAFVVSRYVPTLAGSWTEEPLTAEFLEDPSMFWTIAWLDLGLVVPAAVAAALAVFRGVATAQRAAYAVIGWFALVPPSVAAMSAAMSINDDPHASTANLVAFTAAAVVFGAYAITVYRPLLRLRSERGS